MVALLVTKASLSVHCNFYSCLLGAFCLSEAKTRLAHQNNSTVLGTGLLEGLYRGTSLIPLPPPFPSQDPSVGLYLGSYGAPRGRGVVFNERGSAVLASDPCTVGPLGGACPEVPRAARALWPRHNSAPSVTPSCFLTYQISPFPGCSSSSSSLSSLEWSDTTIFEPETRALFGTAPHTCS